MGGIDFSGIFWVWGAESSEISAKEIGYHHSSLIISKLRLKLGGRRAISKTETGEMNIIMNQPWLT